jgi:arylsulfatase A-like enzyme
MRDDGTGAATRRGERFKVKGTRLTRGEFLKGAGAAGAALLGGVLAGCGPLAQRLPEDYLPEGGPRMNVVVVILDSLRKDHVGAYGNGWIQTPNIDRLAKESLRFTRAYPESIPTINARRAIHTGTRSWPFKDWVVPKGEDIVLQGWQPIPEEQTTLAEVLSDNGYKTMLVTDTMHQFKPSYNMHRGFDAFDFIRGQTTDNYAPNWTFPPDVVERALLKGNVTAMRAQMQQYWANVDGTNGPRRESEEDWLSPQVFSRASEFLEIASGDDGPFFMVVDSYDPHEPWDTPEEYVSLYDDSSYGGKEPFSVIYGESDYLTDRELRRMKARYAGEVTMADRWLGHFLDKMAKLDLFENTLLVFLSDHGVAHGEHGYTGKPSYVLWPEITDVPFMIRHLGGKMVGQTSDYHASTHDVAPTILGFLGIEPPEGMQGQDLSLLFGGGDPEPRPYFTLGYNDHAWVRDETYVMFAKNDGSNPLLFDVREDPNMDRNVAGDNPDVVRSMWNDYILKDAGGPLPRYNMASPPGRS